jgi:mediator of RNA polymerase II transcription subunit 14
MVASNDPAAGARMNDLPDHIAHITEGFTPLSTIVMRMCQMSHNELVAKISEIAAMPLPTAAMNGHSGGNHSGPDDLTVENLRRKKAWLDWLQDVHARWVKLHVIADWSRNAAQVSKLIDLKVHLDQTRLLYDAAFEHSIHTKTSLTWAQLPSPDIRTAYQTLATGTAPHMPDVGFRPTDPDWACRLTIVC